MLNIQFIDYRIKQDVKDAKHKKTVGLDCTMPFADDLLENGVWHTSITKGNVCLVEAKGYFEGNEYTVDKPKLVCVKVEEVY